MCIVKIKPELLKDEHDSNIKFPVNVKIFVKSYNEDWKQVSVKSFKTFESYSLAKFRAFYRQI